MPPLSLMTRPVNWVISAGCALTVLASLWSDSSSLAMVTSLVVLILPAVQPIMILANKRKSSIAAEIVGLMSEIDEIDRELAREAILSARETGTNNPRLEAAYLLQIECKRRGFLINRFISRKDAAIYNKLQRLINQ